MQRVAPAPLGNRFIGHKFAQYVLFVLTALTLWRSLQRLFAYDRGAQSMASAPLDTYPNNAAETVVGIFGP